MNLRRAATVCAASLLFVALAQGEDASAVPAREVVVRVGEALGEVPPLATAGFNYGNSMQVVGYEAYFDAIRVHTLRYPPGNQADEIHVGRHDLEALAMNLDLLGRPPVVMVTNLFGGTAEEAAELARLTRQLDVPVLAWEIGNEPDLYATNRGDPSWTPERWCREFRAQAAALREVDPEAVVAGPGVSGSRPGGERFLEGVLRECGDAMDVLTWHVYPTDGTASDEEALATSASVTDEIVRYRALAEDPESNPLGHDRERLLGITEFGLSWRSPAFRHLEDMTAALWLADVLGRMTRERLDMSHYFALQAMGGHGLIDIGGWVRPTYHVYAMLAGFTGEALEVSVDGPLGVYAVRNGEGTEILLVNLGDAPFSADVRIGDGPAPGFDLATLTESIHDTNLEPARSRVAAGEAVAVPPRSVVHLRTPARLP